MDDFLDSLESIDYPGMIDDAMRSVVKACLERAAEFGLPGEHHFFVSFDTTFPGVQLSPQLKERFPQEMTIVLQHQFWDLDVGKRSFSVMLSFNNIPEKLVVPYAALTAFADPSVKFGLQFHQPSDEDLALFDELEEEGFDVETSFEREFTSHASNQDVKGGEQATAEVISLDSFRKK
jgi:hypothetical protein